MKRYFKLLRVKHYIKNILVLTPLLCSGCLFFTDKLFSGVIAFFAFSSLSSVVYIFNDIRDSEKDRNHPTKRFRPIASGEVSTRSAFILATALLVATFLLNALAFQILSTLLLILYLLLNIGYSLGLKNVPILDVAILVSGFLIRMMYGAIVTGINISNWLYLTVIAVSFYLALGKRRNELKRVENAETRSVLRAYPMSFLDKSMNMFLTLANVFYALWSMDEKTVQHYDNRYLVYSVPIIILISLRYSLIVEGDSDGDPVETLLHDKVLQALSVFYLFAMFYILYFAKTFPADAL